MTITRWWRLSNAALLLVAFAACGCALGTGEIDEEELSDPELSDGYPDEWSGEDDDIDTLSEALTLGSPSAGDPAPVAPPASVVSYARELEERAYGVRIHDQRHRQPRVVYSVRLTDLSPGERLRINAEVTLSRCNEKDIAGESGDASRTPCTNRDLQRSPYTYTPNFSAAIVLGTSPRDASGPRISDWFEQRCPKMRHHCARALGEIRVGDRDLPDSGERFVNLVVTADANGANARSFDVMEVEQRHGGLHVVRLSSSAPPDRAPIVTTNLVASNIPIDRTDSRGVDGENRRVVYRVRLDGLRAGDVIQATGRYYGALGSYDVNPLITSQILLVEDPDTRRPGVDDHDRVLTARNGHNCYDHSSGAICRYAKSGAVVVPRGAPSTMWVQLVGSAVRSDAAPDGRNRVELRGRDGFLAVEVRR